MWHALNMVGGGYVKNSSMKVVDLEVIAPSAKHKLIGARPGEKLHEQMIGAEDRILLMSIKITSKFFLKLIIGIRTTLKSRMVNEWLRGLFMQVILIPNG